MLRVAGISLSQHFHPKGIRFEFWIFLVSNIKVLSKLHTKIYSDTFPILRHWHNKSIRTRHADMNLFVTASESKSILCFPECVAQFMNFEEFLYSANMIFLYKNYNSFTVLGSLYQLPLFGQDDICSSSHGLFLDLQHIALN